MLNLHEMALIEYTKKDGSSTSQRAIIPTFIPTPNIKALDVTDVPLEQVIAMEEALKQYVEYYERAVSNIYKFEDWLSHTQRSVVGEVKWRTFAVENITLLE